MTSSKQELHRGPEDEKIPLPHYLDQTLTESGPRREASEEKESYLRTVDHFVETLNFSPGTNIAVLGVGGGGESKRIAEILEKRFKENGPGILSVDYSPVILGRLHRACVGNPQHVRVIEGLKLLDVMEMGEEIAPESCQLVTLSSIMHELKSYGGWQSTLRGFSQTARITAKGGKIIMRDFASPEFHTCEVNLKTPLASAFFDLFGSAYNPEHKSRWSTEWQKKDNVIITNSLWAFEIATHLRMFLNDYYAKFGEKMLKEKFFRQWPETKESYVLTRENHPSIPKVLEALVTEAAAYGKLTYNLQFTDDSDDDKMLREHLEIENMKDFFPSKRFIATFTKEETSQ